MRGFSKDALKYAPAHLGPVLVGLVALPVLTRICDAEQYGVYVLAMGIAALIVKAFDWARLALVRFYPEAERRGIVQGLNRSLLTGFLVAAVVSSLGAAGGVLILSEDATTYLLTIPLALSYAAFDLLQTFLRVRQRVGRFAAFASWRAVAGLGLGIALFAATPIGIAGLLLGHTGAALISLPLLWLALRPAPEDRGTSTTAPADTKTPRPRELAAYGIPLSLAGIGMLGMSLGDRYVIEWFRTEQEVGVYSAGYLVAEKAMLLVLAVFVFASGPVASRVWEYDDRSASARFLSSVTRYYLVAAVPMVVGLELVSKPLMALVVAPEYVAGHRVIVHVAAGAFLLGLQQRYQLVLALVKRTEGVTVAAFGGLGLNLALNAAFVPRYGYVAAAITTPVSYAVFMVWTMLLAHSHDLLEFPTKTLVRVVIAAAVMRVAAGAIEVDGWALLVAQVLVGIACYTAALPLVGEIGRAEWTAIRGALFGARRRGT